MSCRVGGAELSQDPTLAMPVLADRFPQVPRLVEDLETFVGYAVPPEEAKARCRELDCCGGLVYFGLCKDCVWRLGNPERLTPAPLLTYFFALMRLLASKKVPSLFK